MNYIKNILHLFSLHEFQFFLTNLLYIQHHIFDLVPFFCLSKFFSMFDIQSIEVIFKKHSVFFFEKKKNRNLKKIVENILTSLFTSNFHNQ